MSDPIESGVIGQTFGNYQIEAELGTGGMGRVYRAKHLHLDRDVAIKLLHAHLATDADFRARFQREARSVSQLDHPNIVRLFDYGEQGQTLYLIMELLTDGSLRTLLRARTGTVPQAFDQELELVRQAAEALAYAHERGMVHRDIKPDNLLLKIETHTGGVQQMQLKVADFGLARLAEEASLTASGATMGTPSYMSPEQCQGRQVDTRSDVYSLGIVLYELTVGRVPFTTKSLSDAIYNHVYVAPPTPRSLRPDLPQEVETIILRCLAKHPEDRYASMHDLARDLRGVIDRNALAGIPLALLENAASADAEADSGFMFTTPTPTSSPESRAPSDAPITPPGGVQIPRLYVLNADGAVQQVVDLTGNGLTVGRLDDNDVVLNEPGVSRHHLMIDWNGSDATVTDLGSSNGTMLGGLQLPPQVPRVWNVTDDLRIGPLQLRLARPVSHAALEADTAPAHVASIPATPVAALAGAAGGAVALPLTASADSALPPAAPPGTPTATASADRSSATRLVVLALIVVLIAAGAFLLTRGGDDNNSVAGIVGDAPTATATTGGAAVAAPTTASSGNPAINAPTPTGAVAPGAATTPTTEQSTEGTTTPQPAASTPGSAAPAATAEPLPTPAIVTLSDTTAESTVLEFDAATGQPVLVDISNILIGPINGYGGRVSIYAFNGAEMGRTSLWSGESEALIDMTRLPAAGQYSLVLQLEPGVSFSGTITLHYVPPDAVATIVPGSDAVTITTTSPGQLARLNFDVSAGQRIFVEISRVQLGPSSGYAGTLEIQGPNASSLSQRSLWTSEPYTYIDTVEFPAAGTYALVLDPDKLVTGSVVVRVIDVPPDASGTTTVGGEPVSIVIETPGQNGAVTFEGSANQQITIEARDILVGPTSGYGGAMILLGPDGSEIARKSLWAGEPTAAIETMVLPAAGTYTIVIDPDGGSVFSGNVGVRAGT